MKVKYWFTSDWHFNHKNIIKYSNRPFDSLLEMNNTIIDNFNSVVGPNDVVYNLGDIAFGGDPILNSLFSRLKFGHMHVIKGNHDKNFAAWYRFKRPNNISFYNSYLETKIENQDFTLCHYAMRVWNKSHHGSYSLYGHSHNSLSDDPHSLSFDVGIDAQNYSPISLEQVKEIMNKKTWKPIDHHK